MQNPAEVKGNISDSSRRLWSSPQCKEVKYRMSPSGSLFPKGLKSQKLSHKKSSCKLLLDPKCLVFIHFSDGHGTKHAKSPSNSSLAALPLGEHNLNAFTKMLYNLMLSGN